MTICIVFKNGFELKMKCKKYKITKDAYGNIDEFTTEGISENGFLYMDLSQIQCVYRVLSDEIDKTK